MRVEVEARKIEKENSLLELGKLSVEDAAMLGQDRARLLQIFVIVEHAIGESFRIFGDALAVKLSGFVGQKA